MMTFDISIKQNLIYLEALKAVYLTSTDPKALRIVIEAFSKAERLQRVNKKPELKIINGDKYENS